MSIRTTRLAIRSAFLVLLAGALALPLGAGAQTPTTAFTYQGKLTDGGGAASGSYELRFGLYEAASGGSQLGNAVILSDVPVSDGILTVQLDFGTSPFVGEPRWLEMGVRQGTESFTILPRQLITSVPYSTYALAAGSVAFTNVTGTASPSQLPDTLWKRGGNAGTSAGTDFVGTSDAQPLEFKVDGARVLRLEPNSISPNVIGGSSGNAVTAGVRGATIAGGGEGLYPNRTGDDYGTVAGGSNNTAGDSVGTSSDGAYAAVGGGTSNWARSVASTVAGGEGNSATAGYASIAGGRANTAPGQYSAVGGGQGNAAESLHSTVSGGYANGATGEKSTVAGGWDNRASGYLATVSGGSGNTAAGAGSFAAGRRAKANNIGAFVWSDSSAEADFASTTNNEFAVRATSGARFVTATDGAGLSLGTTDGTQFLTTLGNQPLEVRLNGARVLRLEPASGSPNIIEGYVENAVSPGVVQATVGGGGTTGSINRVTDNGGTVSGGSGNRAGDNMGAVDNSPNATVGGGGGNSAGASYSTVGGGGGNSANGAYATVGGGEGNSAGGSYSTIAGGHSNRTEGAQAAVLGGESNLASGASASVAGGWTNTASADYAFVAGGDNNVASGAGSFAAGHYALAENPGSFVWADSSSNVPFRSSWGDNSFSVRATGGVNFTTGYGPLVNAYLLAGSGSWSSASDRNGKTNVQPLDPKLVLQGVASLPLARWSYQAQDPSIRHIGPMAQDFAAAFSVGEDDRYISTVDADGVALASIQGLYQEVLERDARIAALEQRNSALEAQQRAVEELRQEVAALKTAGGGSSSGSPAKPWEDGLPGSLPVAGGLLMTGWALRSRGLSGWLPRGK